MGYLLLLFSWLLRTYGAILEQRGALKTPVAFQSDTAKTFLMFVWIILLGVGLYFIFSEDGLLMVTISAVVYFVLASMILVKPFSKLLDKLGI